VGSPHCSTCLAARPERRGDREPWAETQFQGGRIALERDLDGLASQSLRLTVEGVLHGLGGTVSRPARAPGRIAGSALFERPPRCFSLFFHQIYSDR
jgi:hypothetical protein